MVKHIIIQASTSDALERLTIDHEQYSTDRNIFIYWCREIYEKYHLADFTWFHANEIDFRLLWWFHGGFGAHTIMIWFVYLIYFERISALFFIGVLAGQYDFLDGK